MKLFMPGQLGKNMTARPLGFCGIKDPFIRRYIGGAIVGF